MPHPCARRPHFAAVRYLVPIAVVAVACDGEPMMLGRTASAWVAALDASDPASRIEAAVAVGTLHITTAAAIAGTVRLLADSVDEARHEAIYALSEIAATSPRVAPLVATAVAEVLRGRSTEGRLAAATVLGSLGVAARQAVVAVSAAACDSSAAVRSASVSALGKIGGPLAATPIRAGLGDPDPDVRASAVDALAMLDPPAPDAYSLLLRMLEDRAADVREQAVQSLAVYGARAKPSLRRALTDTVMAVRRRAERALQRIDRLEESTAAR